MHVYEKENMPWPTIELAVTPMVRMSALFDNSTLKLLLVKQR